METTSAIEAVTEHYERQGRSKKHVPAWNLTVYWSPMTPADRKKAYRPGISDQLLAVEVLWLKAEDEAGNRLFTTPDAHHQLAHRADARIVEEVALEIMRGGDLEAQVEAAEKN